MTNSIKTLFFLAALLGNRTVASQFVGKVLDDANAGPLASVEINVTNLSTLQLVAVVESGSTGDFRTPDLPAGDYRISFSRRNYVPEGYVLHVTSASVAPFLTVWLVRQGTISGTITDKEGRPVAGARVYALRKSGNTGEMRAFGTPATVDGRGFYRLYRLPPGEYTPLIVSPAQADGYHGIFPVLTGPGRQPDRWLSIRGGEEYRNIDSTLATGTCSEIRGYVLKPSAQQSASFIVSLAEARYPGITVASQIVRPDGTFQFTRVAEGSYYITASGPVQVRTLQGAILGTDPRYGRERVEMKGQDVHDVMIGVERGNSARITPRIVAQSQGSKCAHAKISLVPQSSWGSEFDLGAGSQAPFSITGPPDIYRVNLSEPDCRIRDIEYSGKHSFTPILDLRMEPDGPVGITLSDESASIRGTVSQLPTGAKSLVFLIAVSDSRDPEIVATDQGAFSFDKVTPGTYLIAAVSSNVLSSVTHGFRWRRDAGLMTEIELNPGSQITAEIQLLDQK